MLDLFLFIAAFAGGYVASIYTWPWLRSQFISAAQLEAKIRQEAVDLENKIRGK